MQALEPAEKEAKTTGHGLMCSSWMKTRDPEITVMKFMLHRKEISNVKFGKRSRPNLKKLIQNKERQRRCLLGIKPAWSATVEREFRICSEAENRPSNEKPPTNCHIAISIFGKHKDRTHEVPDAALALKSSKGQDDGI